MPQKKIKAWLDFILESRNPETDPGGLSFDGLESISYLTKNIHPLVHHCIPCIYLLDYSTGMYTFFNDNLYSTIGIKKDYFEKGGIDFTVSISHKEDLQLYNDQVFPDRMKFLETIKPEEHANYAFSFNYRLKNNSGKYCSILHRNAYIKADTDGNPLLSLGMIINVDHFKNPNTTVQTIEKITGADYYSGIEKVHTQTYYLHEKEKQLTVREMEFLKYLSDGLSSKKIADKLYLSEHTVKMHRRNMLLKTNTTNVAELIAWAIKKELV